MAKSDALDSLIQYLRKSIGKPLTVKNIVTNVEFEIQFIDKSNDYLVINLDADTMGNLIAGENMWCPVKYGTEFYISEREVDSVIPSIKLGIATCRMKRIDVLTAIEKKEEIEIKIENSKC